jgi:pimeloyl-ACP methyl ester carboxylesterase/glycine cleavage system regulatory protein
MRSVGGDLELRTLEVDERHTSCAMGGHGLPVVFLHGWGLGHRAYQSALRELMARGCRVYAPALPGFGGTAELPGTRRTMEGYAAWVDTFLDTIGVDEPALVVGHSFGGGVAIRLAHDTPQRVRHLVLINSVGSPTGSSGRALAALPYDRPPWEYGIHFMRTLWSRDGYRLMQAMREDAVRNMVVNPWALLEIGALARRVDLTAELAELRRREVPIVVLWGDRDGVLPQGSFDALCAAIGTDGRVLPGGHSWLLANPRALSEVLDNVVQVQVAEHETTGILSTTAELRSLLRRTKIPTRVVTRLLTAASPLWMMSAQPAVLAADLALCHPPLARAEVRAVARPMDDPATYRLTVVAADRPGLLADSAAVLAEEGLSVLAASVATWTDLDIALHSLTFTSTTGAVPDWDALGERLRSIATRPPAASRYAPTGRATVSASGSGPGRSVVRVTAPDGLGLLEATSRWFAARGVSIEAAEIATRGGTATDRFLVNGDFEPSELATYLSRPPTSLWDRLRPHRCRWAPFR